MNVDPFRRRLAIMGTFVHSPLIFAPFSIISLLVNTTRCSQDNNPTISTLSLSVKHLFIISSVGSLQKYKQMSIIGNYTFLPLYLFRVATACNREEFGDVHYSLFPTSPRLFLRITL